MSQSCVSHIFRTIYIYINIYIVTLEPDHRCGPVCSGGKDLGSAVSIESKPYPSLDHPLKILL